MCLRPGAEARARRGFLQPDQRNNRHRSHANPNCATRPIPGTAGVPRRPWAVHPHALGVVWHCAHELSWGMRA